MKLSTTILRHLVILSAATSTRAGAFLIPSTTRSFGVVLSALPTVEALKTDPFMKQVGYASEIVPLLNSNTEEPNEEELTALLKAQLSHSDGIRGFFVNYLASPAETAADGDAVPAPLANAMEAVENSKDLVSLAAMNVIMPTAMKTMHTDPELQQASAKTAARGITVFRHLGQSEKYQAQVNAVVEAILSVSGNVDSAEVEYWKEFFVKWGYEEQQSKDILEAMKSIKQE